MTSLLSVIAHMAHNGNASMTKQYNGMEVCFVSKCANVDPGLTAKQSAAKELIVTITGAYFHELLRDLDRIFAFSNGTGS